MFLHQLVITTLERVRCIDPSSSFRLSLANIVHNSRNVYLPHLLGRYVEGRRGFAVGKDGFVKDLELVGVTLARVLGKHLLPTACVMYLTQKNTSLSSIGAS
jgi:hypothetical protein